MYRRNASHLFAFGVFATLLVASTLSLAADQPNEIRCSSGTSCKKNFIPVFNSNGGSATVKNSIVLQGSGAINVKGAVNAKSSSATNTVFGSNTTPPGTSGAGVYGQQSTTGQSLTGQAFESAGIGGGGTWGDGGADSNYALIGTTDNKAAGIFWNGDAGVDPGFYTNFSFNFATGGVGFPWAALNGDGAGCSIDPVGDLSCTGTKNAVVPVDAGKSHVALSAIESPKNWFEDFGTAQLSGGMAVVRLDPRFLQTVNARMEYHVFLTPNGDCKGLYVHQKDANSFEVRELGGGNSSVKFDYRITALRKNYENIRFANHPEFPLGHDKTGRVFAQK
jgi:hypothetical protein